jgi:hypothetical protein
MRQLYIPDIGDSIRLVADWTFNLYNEDRNSSLMEVIGDPRETTWEGDKDFGTRLCTIPAGAILKVDRIYIRKGLSGYSSLTFLWKDMRTNSKVVDRSITQVFGNNRGPTTYYQVKKPARPVRFWAKLDDVNRIEFEPV